MAQALFQDQEVAFIRNEKGDICIAFSDPAYVRSDTIVLDARDGSLHAILHEGSHPIGQLSRDMTQSFADQSEVLLCAVTSHGGVFELISPLTVIG